MRCYCCHPLLFAYRISRRCASKLSRSDDPTRLVDISLFTPDKIRNFGIVAHVDHGKSTLADRLLELTGVVNSIHEDQMLDRLQVERERGITVKAQTCSMVYKDFLLNLIDTPGHADFNFEVSRSLAASDGILLLVAANQGVQAQTMANFWLAFERGLTIIPVINKIDLKGVNIAQVEAQMQSLFEFEANDIIHISAKSGANVPLVLDSIIQRISAPVANRDSPFLSLIYDSWFDKFRGAVACILVKKGSVTRGDTICSFHGNKRYEVIEVGIMHPGMTPVQRLYAGQVGYIIANMKTVKEAIAGETLFMGESRDKVTPLSGFKPVKPTVFAGLFPLDGAGYDSLKQSIEQLALNDPSVTLTPDSSPALGLGWRIGFLGILHMEVFSSRLEQEYGANVILTAPNVEFRALIKDNETIRKKRYGGKAEVRILDPSKFPDPSDVEKFLEPMVKLKMLIPNEHMGAVNAMCTAARGRRGETQSIDETRLALTWRMPLAEILVDFFEKLKRITSGYASFDYELDGYDEIGLVKMSISVNNTIINEFSQVIPAPMLRERAKLIVSRLKKEIPRQQFEVVLRATIGTSSKVVTQAIIPPMRRDFTQLLKGNFGGGGMERLNKKLSHQKKGKERMKRIGRIQIPKEAFINVLRN